MGSQKENCESVSENIGSIAVYLPENRQDRDSSDQRSGSRVVAEIGLESLSPLFLPKLPLESRKDLPNIPAIYFVVKDIEVLYVGIAERLVLRWVNHHLLPTLSKTDSIQIHWLQIKNSRDLRKIERYFIKLYTPKLNVQQVDERRNIYILHNPPQTLPKTKEELVAESVLNWIGQRTKVYTLDIFSKDCLRLDAADPRRRSWEIKLARILKAKGWYKGRDSKGRYWERKILNSHPTETKHELDDIL